MGSCCLTLLSASSGAEDQGKAEEIACPMEGLCPQGWMSTATLREAQAGPEQMRIQVDAETG